MNLPRDELLTGTALAFNEDGEIGLRHALDALAHGTHDQAGPNERSCSVARPAHCAQSMWSCRMHAHAIGHPDGGSFGTDGMGIRSNTTFQCASRRAIVDIQLALAVATRVTGPGPGRPLRAPCGHGRKGLSTFGPLPAPPPKAVAEGPSHAP